MAFLIHSTDDGRACPWEYKPAGAIQPKIGMALVESSGKLVKVNDNGKQAPTYISMTQTAAAVTAGTIIPVIKVQPDIIFETTWQADAASINDGAKVILHSDGLQLYPTTTDGVATVVSGGGAGAGGTVRLRFI